MIFMTATQMVKNIEASFAMENMYIDNDCRKRLYDVITGAIKADDAIEDIKKKYLSKNKP